MPIAAPTPLRPWRPMLEQPRLSHAADAIEHQYRERGCSTLLKVPEECRFHVHSIREKPQLLAGCDVARPLRRIAITLESHQTAWIEGPFSCYSNWHDSSIISPRSSSPPVHDQDFQPGRSRSSSGSVRFFRDTCRFAFFTFDSGVVRWACLP